MTDALKDKVLRFQRTGRGWDEILREVSDTIYRYPARSGSREEDDAGEFYLFFVSKLRRLVLAYRDRGIPFDHYLNSTMRWNLRSYFRSARRREHRWRMSAAPAFWRDGPEQAAPGSSGGRPLVPGGRPPFSGALPLPTGACPAAELAASPVYRRRLLFLFLRGAREVGSPEIEWFARLSGYDPRWLEERVTGLREGLVAKERRLGALRNRRNRAFARCLVLETEMRGEIDPERRGRLAARIGRLRRTMRQLTDEMARVPLAPTHRAIGEELGVPKGTVDTGLRWARRELADLYAGDQVGYA